MSPEELRRLSRPELIERAEALGIPRPKTLTTGELVDELVTRTAPPGTARRGWLGKARDLVASVVERGLHLPEAAKVLRATQRRAPAPPPPLPTVTLAEIYAAQGYFGKAVTVLNEVLRREPEHEEATTLRARFAGRMSEAEREELGLDDTGAELVGDEPAPEANASETQAAEPTEAVVIEAEVTAAVVKPKATQERPSSSRKPQTEAAETEAAETEAAETEAAETEAAETEAAETEAAETASEPAANKNAPPPAPSSPEAMVVEVQAEAELDARESVPPAAPSDEAEPEADDDAVYDIDDVVGLAVDSHTVYAYWEVRPATFAKARWKDADARLVLRVLVAGSGMGIASDADLVTRDVAIDELVGDTFIRGLPGAAEVRLCVGMLGEQGFTPIAVAPELATPRELRNEPAVAPAVLPPVMAQSFGPAAPDATSPEGAALAVQQWAMFSRSRSGELTAVDFGHAAVPESERVLVRRTLRSEVVRGGASDLIRRDVAAEERATRWGPGGASDMARGRASDLSRGHASDLSRRSLS